MLLEKRISLHIIFKDLIILASLKLKGTWDQNFTPAFMTCFCYFYGERVLYKFQWCFAQFSRSSEVTKFWIWCKWRHTREYTKHFTAGFLCIFLLILWRNNIYKSFKEFLTIFHELNKLCPEVNDVIHANEHT